MKINKLLEFLGIRNEGWKRALLIGFIPFSIVLYIYFENDFYKFFDNYFYNIFRFFRSIGIEIILYLFCFIFSYLLIVKVVIWIIDGFKKEDSNTNNTIQLNWGLIIKKYYKILLILVCLIVLIETNPKLSDVKEKLMSEIYNRPQLFRTYGMDKQKVIDEIRSSDPELYETWDDSKIFNFLIFYTPELGFEDNPNSYAYKAKIQQENDFRRRIIYNNYILFSVASIKLKKRSERGHSKISIYSILGNFITFEKTIWK